MTKLRLWDRSLAIREPFEELESGCSSQSDEEGEIKSDEEMEVESDGEREVTQVSSPKLPSKTLDTSLLNKVRIYQSHIEPPQNIKCGCRTRCVSPRCTCRKWGAGCNPDCACHASSRCKNKLNAILPAIFEPRVYGEHLPASDCFARFLAEEVKLDHENEDFEEDFEDLIGKLRNRLISHTYGNLHGHSSCHSDDKYLRQWSSRWSRGFMIPMERERHLIGLLRYGLTDDRGDAVSTTTDGNAGKGKDERAFYSFCQLRWVLKSRMWHCRACGRCRSRRHWFCGKCKKCSHGLKLPCEGCGGVCEEYSYDDVSDTDCRSEDGSDTRDD